MPNFGPYELLQRLGSGGMGEVFLARLTRGDAFEKLLVIKRMLPHCSDDPDFQAFFQREAKLAALLSHQNIVQIFDYGQVKNQSFIAMEFIDGIDAATLLQQLPSGLPLAHALTIISGAARGLDYAHRKTDLTGRPLDLIHRDVNLRNLLLSFEGEVKWIDFGLAFSSHRSGHADVIAGTPAYMSPEQAEGGLLDARSDLFSLAVSSYELLTGQRPFAHTQRLSDHAQACRDTEISPPSTLRDLPAAIDLVLLRALAPFPDDRYPSVRAFLDAFEVAAAHPPASPQQLGALIREHASQSLAAQLRHTRERTQVGDDPIASQPTHDAHPPQVTATDPAMQPFANAHTTTGTDPAAQPITARLDDTTTASDPDITQAYDPPPPDASAPHLPSESRRRAGAERRKSLQRLSQLPDPNPTSRSVTTRQIAWLSLGVLLGLGITITAVWFALDTTPNPPPRPPTSTLDATVSANTSDDVVTSTPDLETARLDTWTLRLSVIPADVNVFINDQPISQGTGIRADQPLSFELPQDANTFTLRIQASSYRPYVETVTRESASDDLVITRNVELDFNSALRFDIQPATIDTAKITINDKLSYDYPQQRRIDVAAAQGIIIKVSHPHYQTWSETVDLKPDQELTLTPQLEPKPCTVHVTTKPQKTGVRLQILTPPSDPGTQPTVRLDCTTPCKATDLMPGTYQINVLSGCHHPPVSELHIPLGTQALDRQVMCPAPPVTQPTIKRATRGTLTKINSAKTSAIYEFKSDDVHVKVRVAAINGGYELLILPHRNWQRDAHVEAVAFIDNQRQAIGRVISLQARAKAYTIRLRRNDQDKAQAGFDVLLPPF